MLSHLPESGLQARCTEHYGLQALALAEVMHGQRGMTFRKRLLSNFD